MPLHLLFVTAHTIPGEMQGVLICWLRLLLVLVLPPLLLLLPQAATMKEMQALVVSKETTAGANWINDHRASQGSEPLEVVVVGLIGADSQDEVPLRGAA